MLHCSKFLALCNLPGSQTICASRRPSWAGTPSVSAQPLFGMALTRDVAYHPIHPIHHGYPAAPA